MSHALLSRLNGTNSGHFSDWLDKHPWEPRIAWYPSCGGDFKDLLYLHKSYLWRRFQEMPQPPDIFIHTDCSIGLSNPFHQLRINDYDNSLYCDERTTITVLLKEELPTLELSIAACQQGYTQFEASDDYGRVFFLLLQIDSDRLGVMVQPVIYAIVENGAFASEVLLETAARISHIWNVLPGSRPNPWIGYLLKRLQTECFFREKDFFNEEELTYQRE